MSTIMRTFLLNDDQLVSSENSFIGFKVLAEASGRMTKWVQMKDNRYDLNSMAKKILDSGIGDNFYLRNKWDDHAWQRLLGIIFAQENYPANKHSIIGESRPETDHSNNKYANKMFLNRDIV